MNATIDNDKILSRFWPKVNKTETCWLWTGGRMYGSTGLPYGSFWNGTKNDRAHRFAYEEFVGQIPPGLTIDHVKARGCTSTLCVNPDHLEAVTMRENLLRGSSFSAKNARKTHCKHRHEFTPENTRLRPTGGRSCRKCHQELKRRIRLQRASRLAPERQE